MRISIYIKKINLNVEFKFFFFSFVLVTFSLVVLDCIKLNKSYCIWFDNVFFILNRIVSKDILDFSFGIVK